MAADKQEYSPLLPTGLHEKSLNDLRELCIEPFKQSRQRLKIMEGLEQIIWELSDLGIESRIWIGGSFVTKKIEPDDSDIVVCVKDSFLAGANQEQGNYLNNFLDTRRGRKQKYSCDAYVHIDNEDSKHSKFMHRYWLSQFGSSRAGDEKGIVVICTPTGER